MAVEKLSKNQQKIAATIVQYFQGKGYSLEQASGIAGNMFVESRYNIGAVDPNDKGKESIGICQWRAERNTNLRNYASSSGNSWTNLGVQLSFTSHELSTSEKSTPGAVKATSTPQQAALAWAKNFERCDSASYNDRQTASLMIYNGIKSGTWEAGDAALINGTSSSGDSTESTQPAVEGMYDNAKWVDVVQKGDFDTSDPFKDLSQYASEADIYGDFEPLSVSENTTTTNQPSLEDTLKEVKSDNAVVYPPVLTEKMKPSIQISEHSWWSKEEWDKSEQVAESSKSSSEESVIDNYGV